MQKLSNVGDNDASPDNTPSQFLLLRGLEPSVTEEVFSRGVTKLMKPGGDAAAPKQTPGKKAAKVASTTGDANLGAREGTLRRVFIVRDRRTNDSWRFGFAEFASIEDAQAALTRYSSFDKFTIASKPVMVSYVHSGVFVPVLNPSPLDEQYTFNPLINRSLKIAYWDDGAYVKELTVTEAPSEEQERMPSRTDLAAAAASSEGLATEKAKKRKQEAVASSSSKKATPSHLQFWSNRHAELHSIKEKQSSNGNSNQASSFPAGSTPEAGAAPALTKQSFADSARNCCYLCQRQFTTTAEVNKHERLSELHRSNLKDETIVARGMAKLEKHGLPIRSSDNASTAEYRDRARERRKVHGVVNKSGQSVQQKAGNASAPKPKLDGDSDDDPFPQSKGASLLSKMGYTSGSGLGASGDGRTEVLNQDVYVAGVGLGAAGGRVGDAMKEAERNTKGDYAGFAEKTRDTARERYNKM